MMAEVCEPETRVQVFDADAVQVNIIITASAATRLRRGEKSMTTLLEGDDQLWATCRWLTKKRVGGDTCGLPGIHVNKTRLNSQHTFTKGVD